MDSRFKGLLLFIISWEGWVRTVCCQDEQRLNRCYMWHCQEKTPQVLQSRKNVDLKHGIALCSPTTHLMNKAKAKSFLHCFTILQTS